LREKGMKTDPPFISTFSLETTQWMIFDSYMQAWEDIQRAVRYLNHEYILGNGGINEGQSKGKEECSAVAIACRRSSVLNLNEKSSKNHGKNDCLER
jgi:hypothetical protein